MVVQRTRLVSHIVERRPVVSDGNSGNTIEQVTLGDGRRLLLKRVSPGVGLDGEGDARSGPARIHVGKRPAGPSALRDRPHDRRSRGQRGGVEVFMRDVSAALIRPDLGFSATGLSSSTGGDE